MNNTKTIFKSLLIMIVAISLFTVSCSKDEGGGKPTDPIVTLGVTDLNAIVTSLVQLQTKWTVTEQAITDFAPQNGAGSISVEVKEAFDVNGLKTALSSRNQAGVKVTVALNGNAPSDVASETPVKFDITIDIGNNNFAEGVNGPYTVKDKTAKLTLTITPTNKWDLS